MEYQELLYSAVFWTLMNITAILGFLIGILTVIQIKLTSPLTHNMAGTAKACLQKLLALVIWQNPWTWRGMIGVLLVILGGLIYAYVRSGESKGAPPPTPTIKDNDPLVVKEIVEMEEGKSCESEEDYVQVNLLKDNVRARDTGGDIELESLKKDKK